MYLVIVYTKITYQLVLKNMLNEKYISSVAFIFLYI